MDRIERDEVEFGRSKFNGGKETAAGRKATTAEKICCLVNGIYRGAGTVLQ